MSVCKSKYRPTFTLRHLGYPVRILNGSTMIGFKVRHKCSEYACLTCIEGRELDERR